MILYKDRKTKKLEKELVYGESFLVFVYKDNFLSRIVSFLTARIPLFSKFYGFIQKLPITKRNIWPFVEKYQVDKSEFATTDFKSFNDFFTRKLKKEARPINQEEKVAIIPADGRFLFFSDIKKSDGFLVKGKKFSILKLLDSEVLAKEYENGSLVLGRLCPADYHRFHFPCNGVASDPRLINGPLYSVNPISVKKNISILAENKRMITEFATDHFGKVLYIEVGATCVGTIHQTYTPQKYYHKGDEKGFFSFGGSSVILLFEKNRIQFDDDLLENSSHLIETRVELGQSMGRAFA